VLIDVVFFQLSMSCITNYKILDLVDLVFISILLSIHFYLCLLCEVYQ